MPEEEEQARLRLRLRLRLRSGGGRKVFSSRSIGHAAWAARVRRRCAVAAVWWARTSAYWRTLADVKQAAANFQCSLEVAKAQRGPASIGERNVDCNRLQTVASDCRVLQAIAKYCRLMPTNLVRALGVCLSPGGELGPVLSAQVRHR